MASDPAIRTNPTPGAETLHRFGPPSSPIIVRNASPLLDDLTTFLDGWPCAAQTGAGSEPDADVIELRDGAFVIRTRPPYAGEAAFANAFDAANGLAGILAGALVCADPASVCLHAGAAKIGDGVVLMLGDSMAGKSSVSLYLAAAGCALFGDDRIAVRSDPDRRAPPVATCLGLLPKLRLPLPAETAPEFREFVATYTARTSDDAAYLGPDIPGAAGFGDLAPVIAVVLLDRRTGAPAATRPVLQSALVQLLIRNAYAPHLPTARLVDACARLADAVPARQLTFGDSASAARLLIEKYDGEKP